MFAKNVPKDVQFVTLKLMIQCYVDCVNPTIIYYQVLAKLPALQVFLRIFKIYFFQNN